MNAQQQDKPRLGGPGHRHVFDPISGWCAHCNLRDDGRLVSPGGNVWHHGEQQQLTEEDYQ